MVAKKKPRQFEIETVDVPIPTGDGELHLIEAKMLVLMPAGYSLQKLQGVLYSCLLRGAHGELMISAEYGAAMHNKTLQSSGGRAAYVQNYNPSVICTGFDNKKLPKGVSTIKVLREKLPKSPARAKKVKSGTRG